MPRESIPPVASFSRLRSLAFDTKEKSKMKCHQCGKPAMFVVGLPDKQIPLCLDCNIKLEQLLATKGDMLERGLNYIAAQMEAAVGLPGIFPRYPERRIIKAGDITMNNIKIDHSNIGVLNTGTIGTVDAAITVLRQSGDQIVSTAIQALTEAIIADTAATEELKNQAIEILSVLATEATAPKEQRRRAVIKTLVLELSTLLGGAVALEQLWHQYSPVFMSLFQ
jgi:hypothetical protein